MMRAVFMPQGRHRFGHIDAALVDRRADDGAGQPATAGQDRVEGEEVVEGADASGRDDVEIGGGQHLGQPIRVRATHQALDLDLGDHDRLGSRIGEPPERRRPLDA